MSRNWRGLACRDLRHVYRRTWVAFPTHRLQVADLILKFANALNREGVATILDGSVSGPDFDERSTWIASGDHDTGPTRPPHAEPAPTPAAIAKGTAAEVAALIRARPGQQAALFNAIHQQRGNTFAQQVLVVLQTEVRAADTVVTPDAREPDDVDQPEVKDTKIFGSRFTGDPRLMWCVTAARCAKAKPARRCAGFNSRSTISGSTAPFRRSLTPRPPRP